MTITFLDTQVFEEVRNRLSVCCGATRRLQHPLLDEYSFFTGDQDGVSGAAPEPSGALPGKGGGGEMTPLRRLHVMQEGR